MKQGFLMTMHNLVESYEVMCQPIRKDFQLPQAAFDILLFLANNPEYKNAKDIIKYRGLKSNVVSINVDKLVNEGYLIRQAVPNDRRKVELLLTNKAAPVVAAGQSVQKVFQDTITIGMSDQDKQRLEQYTELIIRNINNIKKK